MHFISCVLIEVCVHVHPSRLWDRDSMEEVKSLTFDTSVSSMEYVADGEILVITYGKTIAFYNALRSTLFSLCTFWELQWPHSFKNNARFFYTIYWILNSLIFLWEKRTNLCTTEKWRNGHHELVSLTLLKLEVVKFLDHF